MSSFFQSFPNLGFHFWPGALPLPLPGPHQRQTQAMLQTNGAPPNIAEHLAAYYATASAHQVLQTLASRNSNQQQAVVGISDAHGGGGVDMVANEATALDRGSDDKVGDAKGKRIKSDSGGKSDASDEKLSEGASDILKLRYNLTAVSAPNHANGTNNNGKAIKQKMSDDGANGSVPDSMGANGGGGAAAANGDAQHAGDMCGNASGLGTTTSAPRPVSIPQGNGDSTTVDAATARANALSKYRLKRSQRCFQKKIRYESRKQLANSRPRVRGQFVSYSNTDGKGSKGDKDNGNGGASTSDKK